MRDRHNQEEMAGGLAAGVDEYQIKLNKDVLPANIRRAVRKHTPDPAAEGRGCGIPGELP